MYKFFFLPLIAITIIALNACGHDTETHDHHHAQYLGNEGVMVVSSKTKILFDPIYANGFGTYQMVPPETRRDIIQGAGDFENVDAIFQSHMHPDHFAPTDMARLLLKNPDTQFYAHQQSVDMLRELYSDDAAFWDQIHEIDMEIGDKAHTILVDDLHITAIRTPHSGGERHAQVANMIFRVEIEDGVTVMHMGDATVEMKAYKQHDRIFLGSKTHMAFPPYWLPMSIGEDQFKETFNTDKIVSTHVPIKLPDGINAHDYFHQSGDMREVVLTAQKVPTHP